jgi:hypothetical protein
LLRARRRRIHRGVIVVGNKGGSGRKVIQHRLLAPRREMLSLPPRSRLGYPLCNPAIRLSSYHRKVGQPTPVMPVPQKPSNTMSPGSV